MVLCWALLFTSYSNAQDISTTGNLVTPTTTTSGSTWGNAVYQDSLTCWRWGYPGYCGPNPIVRPGDSINFSFGYTDIYQVKAIADVLPNSGVGLRVNGYNFSFTAKNGNGWDNGQTDYLSAYVFFTGNSGPWPYYKTYDLNYKFNWTTFNFSETFTTPYASKDLKTVQYGFVGGDSNYWAGPYGPEIYNISFSLKYSTDPCASDVLSSPSCPGYLDAINKYTAPAPVLAEPTTVSSPTQTTTTVVDPITSTPVTTITSSPIMQTISTKTIEPAALQSGSNKAGGPSVSQILGIVRAEQSRVKAVETSTVQQAVETSQRLTEQAKQDGEKIATTQSANSQQTSATTQNTVVQQNNLVQSEFSALKQATKFDSVQLTNTNTQQLLDARPESASMYQLNTKTLIEPIILPPQQYKAGELSVVSYIPETTPTFIDPQQSRLNKLASNDLAGDKDLQQIAVVPNGFLQYTQLTLTDAKFYSIRPVYQNQRVVDNQRALRQLSSDRLHEQMVDQQYQK